ncbi:hypothetical protein LTR95_005331 [Oleoguttula sp. CCFEE 5521]
MSASPSAQLLHDLRLAMTAALSSRRPILHHLNADNSWLLQIPRPTSATRKGSQIYYNILIDPWFTGGQTDISWWFSLQFHAIPSAVQSIREVEELIRRNEVVARGDEESEGEQHGEGAIDAVAISHEFTDHCHEETLKQVGRDVPVFAVRKAVKLIQSWRHFRIVVQVPVYEPGDGLDWRETSLLPLPAWIGISRLEQKSDPVGLHAALMIAFDNGRRSSAAGQSIEHINEDDAAEALFHTPHGISHGAISTIIEQADPPIKTIALLHGLSDVKVGETPLGPALQINLGARNGAHVQQALRAKYWFGTHDEVKKGSGIVAKMIKSRIMALDPVLAEEQSRGTLSKEAAKACLASYEELGSGASRVLECSEQ